MNLRSEIKPTSQSSGKSLLQNMRRHRFQRTSSRSNSSVSSHTIGKSKNAKNDLKSNNRIGTYIKDRDNSITSQQLQSEPNKEKSVVQRIKPNSRLSKINPQSAAILDTKEHFRQTDNKLRKSVRIQENNSVIDQTSECRLLEELLQKERKMKQDLQTEYDSLVEKCKKQCVQCQQLEQALKQKNKQIRRLNTQIQSLQQEQKQTLALWQSIDGLEMDKIKKDQQIRQLLLVRQTDEKTILRLKQQLNHLTKYHHQPTVSNKTPQKSVHFDNNETVINPNEAQQDFGVKTLPKVDNDRQKEFNKLHQQIRALNSQIANGQKKYSQEKRKMGNQYEKKFTSSPNSYKKAQRDSNVFERTNRNSHDLDYSLSPELDR